MMPERTSVPTPPESTQKTSVQHRLKNWVVERPFWLVGQRRVRSRVANAFITDLLHPVSGNTVPEKLQRYRHNVDASISYCSEKLRGLPTDDFGIVLRSQSLKDSVSGEPFRIEVVHGTDGWTTREVGRNGVISSARLFDDGRTEATLSYEEKRYLDRQANPNIQTSPNYPTGARVLFLNHLASVGVIGWGRKTKMEILRKSRAK